MKVVCGFRKEKEEIRISTGDLINFKNDWWMAMGGDKGYNMVSLSDGIKFCDEFESLSILQTYLESYIKLIPDDNFLKSTKVKLEIKRR